MSVNVPTIIIYFQQNIISTKSNKYQNLGKRVLYFIF